MRDILFKTEDYIFSYRVAGIVIIDNKILLQKPIDEEGFSFPGGHVSIGETNEETLIREFKEEINADIIVKELRWVGEIFFPWGNKPCHQLGLFFNVELCDREQIPNDGFFYANEILNNNNFKLEFHWIPLDKINNIKIYPLNAVALLHENKEGVFHFVYKQ